MRIIIACKPDGTVATRTEGVVGTACEGSDDFLKKAWRKMSDARTPEYFETREEKNYEQQ